MISVTLEKLMSGIGRDVKRLNVGTLGETAKEVLDSVCGPCKRKKI